MSKNNKQINIPSPLMQAPSAARWSGTGVPFEP